MRAQIFRVLFGLWLIALVFLVFAPRPAHAAGLILNNAPISDLARWVTDQTGRTITFADSSDVPVNVNIADADAVDPWSLFQSAAAAAGLNINQVDSFYVVSAQNFSEQPEPIDYPIMDYYYSVYPTNLEDIQQGLSTLVGSWQTQEQLRLQQSIPTFSVQSSAENSTLVVSIPEHLKQSADLFIDTLNKPPKQVLVEAIVFETSDLDFQVFDLDVRNLVENGLSLDFGATTGALAVVGKGGGISYSSQGTIKGVLRALDTVDSTSVLSTPELRIIDRETGIVQVGKSVPFITSTSTSDNGQVTNSIVRQNIGLNFSVTPTVQPDDSVRMQFSTSVGSLTGDSTAADVITSNRSVETVIDAQSGELVYLGGLITEDLRDSAVSVPGLSKIPLLGRLFARDETRKERTKLAVFIKTTVL